VKVLCNLPPGHDPACPWPHAAVLDLSAVEFPLTIEAFDLDDLAMAGPTWTVTIPGPGSVQIPAFGRQMRFRLRYGDGTQVVEPPLIDLDNPPWPCAVCGEERPFAAISVVERTLAVLQDLAPEQIYRVKYCNDRPDCVAQATAEGPWTGRPQRDRA